MAYAATYSASRLDTFESCRLKYLLSYKKGYYAEETQQSVLTRKGSAFHELAETYDPNWSPDYLLQRRLEIEQKFLLPEEFSLERPTLRFQKFFDEIIAAAILNGWSAHREIEFKFEVKGKNFTGKLDVLLASPDNKQFFIIDYKTGKSANTSYYTGQMMLYAWALHKQYGVELDGIENNVQIGLFFPMANPDEEDYLKVFKKLKFNRASVEKEVFHFHDLITIIESGTWEADASLSKLCDFCAFRGFKQYCPMSAKAGLVPTRGTRILQKEWAVQQGIK